ncbi:MAG: BrnT family toxin [bacterium]|jgi:uncharacterized DUF497 family protein|nr:BrnT family toxin [bacterium]
MNDDVHFGSFTWNAAKERENIHRHGLSFREATAAFADPHRLITHDDKHSSQEERLFCVGRVNNRVATVRFTYRDKKVRIIGAGFWRKGKVLYEKTRS